MAHDSKSVRNDEEACRKFQSTDAGVVSYTVMNLWQSLMQDGLKGMSRQP
jgi:hypothetical protein